MAFPGRLRGLLLLPAVPLITLFVCLFAMADVFFFRKSAVKAQVFPRLWGRMICRLAGIRVRIEGIEHIDPEQTYIFAGNHLSQVDIWSFQGYFPHDFRWIAKKELFRIPIFGPAMRRVDFIPIDRSRGRQAVKSLHEAAERIAAGSSVLIFPEGTRSPDGRIRSFKNGAIMLAMRAGVPLVPVGFNKTATILPKGKLLTRSGEVVIRIGTPIATTTYTGQDKQELTQLLYEDVLALLDEEHHPLQSAGKGPSPTT